MAKPSILESLKQNRGTTFQQLKEKMETQENGGYAQDERIYKPKLDKQKGKNYVRLRFLPPQEQGCPSWVELKEFSFKGQGGATYWQKSRATLINSETGRTESDPALTARINAYKKRKATGDERYGDIGKHIRENRKFYYNVMIIEDELQPECVGKVKILQVGPQIAGIIEKAISPEFPTQAPIDPFDLWSGHDFFINITAERVGQDTMPSYKASCFDQHPSEFGTDQEKEDAVLATYDLREFIDPSNFKSFDELAAEFKRVYGKPYNWLDPNYSESVANKMDSEPTPSYNEEPEPKVDTSYNSGRSDDEAPWDEPDDDSSNDEPEVPAENQSTKSRIDAIKRMRESNK